MTIILAIMVHLQLTMTCAKIWNLDAAQVLLLCRYLAVFYDYTQNKHKHSELGRMLYIQDVCRTFLYEYVCHSNNSAKYVITDMYEHLFKKLPPPRKQEECMFWIAFCFIFALHGLVRKAISTDLREGLHKFWKNFEINTFSGTD